LNLDQGLRATLRGTRAEGGGYDLELVISGGSGPSNRTTVSLGRNRAPPPPSFEATPEATATPGDGTAARLFEGDFTGNGEFTAGACSWGVTLTGTIEATVNFAGSRAEGEAHVRAHATTERTGGSPQCVGDEQDWDDRVAVSGTRDDITFVVDAEPFLARFTGYLDGSGAIIGRIDVTSTEPEIDGSVTADVELEPR